MGYRLLQFNQSVRAYEELAYRKERGWMDHIAKTASHALADQIFRHAGKLYKRIDPKDPDAIDAEVVHRFEIGVELDPDELRARQNDMMDAKREGMMLAAKRLQEAAAAYDHVDGHCRHVLKHTLLDQAKRIEQEAAEL